MDSRTGCSTLFDAKASAPRGLCSSDTSRATHVQPGAPPLPPSSHTWGRLVVRSNRIGTTAIASALRYARALALIGAALLLAHFIENAVALTALLFLAIIVSARYSGSGPGLIAIAAATPALEYVAFGPPHTFRLLLADVPVLATFAASAVVACWLVAVPERAERALRRRFEKEIGDHRAANEALYESQQLLQAVFDNAATVIHVKDLEGRFILVNRSFEALVRLPRDEILGKRSQDFFLGEEATAFEDLDRVAASAESSIEAEEVASTASGVHTFLTTKRPLAAASGKVYAVFGMSINITERKRVEEALRRSEEQYRLMFASNPHPMWVFDLETLAFLEVNDAAVRHYGFKREEFLAMTIRDIRPEEDVVALVANVEGRVEGLRPSGVWRHRKKDGSVIQVEVTGHTVVFEGRQAELILAHDITRRMKAEGEVRLLNEELEGRVAERTTQLEAAVRELDAFCYSVSHDLRAPLRAIDGFSRILLEDHAAGLEGEAREYLDLVRDNAQRMGQLIDDLLRLSRLSRQALRTETVDTASIVRAALEALMPELTGRKVDVAIGELPPCKADPALLKQVFLNLLSNALKYSRRRESAAVEVGALDRDARGEVTYFVKDNGTGFDMRYAGKLFGVFQRLHRVEEFEGTGVGLAIVERIVTQHGGQVRAEGELDKGATFFVTLPAAGTVQSTHTIAPE
jgi:PAS domain S-box-containing protein